MLHRCTEGVAAIPTGDTSRSARQFIDLDAVTAVLNHRIPSQAR